jgi:hypothetical protein
MIFLFEEATTTRRFQVIFNEPALRLFKKSIGDSVVFKEGSG